jgi:hypothetical protein
MPNTANYSFPTPADTDLVKNGADAIRDLGDAVDTAMNTALGTKKSGLVLLNTTSFSAVASQSVNDVFSTTYDNYKVLIRLNASSVTSNAFFRLRVSGADNTSGVYYYMANYFSASSTNVPVNANNATQWNLFQTGTTAASHIDLTIFNPFIAQKTTASGTTSAANATVAFGGAWAGLWDGTTSFTGFTIIGESGNLTGNVSVYGVNK